MPNQLQDFLQKDLIAELGLQALPDDKKEEMVLRIGELIQQNIVLRIISELPEGDKEEFEKVLDENNGEKTLEFLQTKFPNLNQVVEDEITKFKQEAISQMQAVVGQK
jgi:hypothetical protein